MKRGKKYSASVESIDREALLSPTDAVKGVRAASFANFDETFEVVFNLGIDPKQADQAIRGTLSLPHGTGKSTRVVAVVPEELIKESESAGADAVGAEDLIEKISGGWLDFDILITTPAMMSKVARLGKTLGGRGLMPSPKSGTVTQDVAQAIKSFKAGKFEYRNDKAGIVHFIIGKKSFSDEQLVENFECVYDTLQKAKPGKAKGIYMKSIALSTSMSPSLRVDPAQTKWGGGSDE